MRGQTPTIMWIDDEIVPFSLHDGGAGDGDDTLCHYTCECDDDFAVCGKRLVDAIETDFDDDGPDVCVVCVELTICLRCGRRFDS